MASVMTHPAEHCITVLATKPNFSLPFGHRNRHCLAGAAFGDPGQTFRLRFRVGDQNLGGRRCLHSRRPRLYLPSVRIR